jgi:hypothetical protein
LPLRIGFDLDGVLADMDTELVRHAEGLFGESMTHRLRERASESSSTASGAADPTDAPSDAESARDAATNGEPPLLKLNLTSRQQRKLWRHVESIENFWETLKEIEPGAVAQLAAVALANRWEVIFLTKRPQSAGSTAQLQSQRWLESNGFTLPSVYVVQGSRGRIAAALGLDVVVDDRPENCLDVAIDSKARAILVWRDDDKNLPAATQRLGIGVVKTVADCLDILTRADSNGREPESMMSRLMRLLGLKDPPAATI